VSEIKIPEINIPSVEVPQYPPFQHRLEGKIPGCNYWHRDLETTRNPSLLIADPNGTFITCPEGNIPSFNPMRFDQNEIIYVEEIPQTFDPKTTNTNNQIQPKPVEEEKIEYVICPSNKQQRVGDFRNEKRLERVIGHELSEDGKECITLYEPVAFKDQYIPEVSSIVSTAVIGLVAASSPLLLNAVKPLVKQIVKKLTKKKDKVE
tara:strand:- start:928 stop:1545 length:618 start_codon:yes stop_codon:yes gene_type:complete